MLGLQVHSLGEDHRPGVFECLPQHLTATTSIPTRAAAAWASAWASSTGGWSTRRKTARSSTTATCAAPATCPASTRMEFDVLEPLYAVREECVKNGQTVPVWDKLVESMAKAGPTLLGATGKRGQWAKGLDVKDYATEKVDVVYHAGCLASYDEASGKVAAAAVSLLGKAGLDVGIAKDSELCCGGRAYEMGYRDEALEAGRAERRPLQGVRSHGTGDRLRPLLPVLQGALSQAGTRSRCEGHRTSPSTWPTWSRRAS